MRLIAAAMLLLLLTGCLQQKFSGIAPDPHPAPEFTLTNQDGERVSLQDFRGKTVVMSFMYTNCPTVCPLITSKFLRAAEMMGESLGKEVVFIGVTVDPERDTPEAVRRFLEGKGMLGRMEYLTGDREEVEKVWENYNVYVNKTPEEQGGYQVDHTAVVYLIDREGYLRVLYPGLEWYPKYLVEDIRTLQKEGNPFYRFFYGAPGKG